MTGNAHMTKGYALLPSASLSTRKAELPSCGLRGWKVARHALLDSTNMEARRVLASGDAGRRIIVADEQTEGRCRHDRLWESPRGKGLWASFIVPAATSFSSLPQSTLVLAVAVREAVLRATGVALAIKWPNDLLGNGRKCCGLLVETNEPVPGGHASLILGVGVNCNQIVEDFSAPVRETATSLSMLADGRRVCRETLLARLADSIAHWFSLWEEQGFSPVREAWLSANCTTGKRILLPEGYGYTQATAHDLAGTGALVALADDGTALLIDSGEVRFTWA